MPIPFSDIALSRRLEAAEAQACAGFVAGHAAAVPDSGAQRLVVEGTWAMFDRPVSPATQTFRLGLFETPTAAGMEIIEQFFIERGAPVLHEVSPMGDPAVMVMLNQRGYRPVELSSVMFMPLEQRAAPKAGGIAVRLATAEDRDIWIETAAKGWAEYATLQDMEALMAFVAISPNSLRFLAELDGQAVATADLVLHEGVAMFAGASTVPDFRNRGAQTALLEARLDYAANAGCDLAMMCAAPGSGSQRNAERRGFRTAYTRTKWGLFPNEPENGSRQ